jgi:hypothetical protein
MKTKLNQKGLLHNLILAAFVVVFAVAGVAYLVASHANPKLPPMDQAHTVELKGKTVSTEVTTARAKRTLVVRHQGPKSFVRIYGCGKVKTPTMSGRSQKKYDNCPRNPDYGDAAHVNVWSLAANADNRVKWDHEIINILGGERRVVTVDNTCEVHYLPACG